MGNRRHYYRNSSRIQQSQSNDTQTNGSVNNNNNQQLLNNRQLIQQQPPNSTVVAAQAPQQSNNMLNHMTSNMLPTRSSFELDNVTEMNSVNMGVMGSMGTNMSINQSNYIHPGKIPYNMYLF